MLNENMKAIRKSKGLSQQELAAGSPYLGWDFRDPELAMAGTVYHAFEWLFVRLAPFVLIVAAVGVFLTRKKHDIG